MIRLLLAAAGRRQDNLLRGPGSNVLLGGDSTWGYAGELPSLIEGGALASQIGLMAGTAVNGGTDWLKFVADGKVVFIPKKPLRKSLSWSHIYARGAVYGTGDHGVSPAIAAGVLQNAVVTIGQDTFRVRLLKGIGMDPSSVNQGLGGIGTDNSEWNRLLYNVMANNLADGQLGAAWDDFNYADLGLDVADGSRTLVQEQSVETGGVRYRHYRGRQNTVKPVFFAGETATLSLYGWRPVLELI